jgi:hypothetical protein
MKLKTLLLLVLLNIACNNEKADTKKSLCPQYLTGYWIPQRIKWEIEDPRYKDSGRMFETTFFRTLCFDTTNQFIYFGSVQRHQKNDNDSLVFAGEPLVTVFAGSWEIINDTLLKVDYMPIEYNINPPHTKERHEQIKIKYDKDTLLLFDNTLYQRTNKYDSISRREMEEYKRHYLK